MGKKIIKELTVQMTFRVGLQDVTVSESVFNGLRKMEEEGNMSDDEISLSNDKEIIEASEWLNSNIKSGDAFSWEYEIEDLIE